MNAPETTPETYTEFISLLTTHQMALRSFIVSLMPGSPDVNDLLQETNVTLWKKMTSFEPGSNFKAWAFTIARYEVQNFRRKAVNKKQRQLDDTLLDLIASEAESMEDQTDNRIYALQSCLENLSKKQRKLILERYNKGTSLAKFARKTNQSADSLRVTLFRVRNTLRNCVTSKLNLAK